MLPLILPFTIDTIEQAATANKRLDVYSQVVYSITLIDCGSDTVTNGSIDYQKIVTLGGYDLDVFQSGDVNNSTGLDNNVSIYSQLFSNKLLAFNAAKKTFGIDIEHDDTVLAKDISCITNAMRNIKAFDLKIVQPDSESLDFYYAVGGQRVVQIISSFPRVQDENVTVLFYIAGECVYMNDMPLKELVNDLEEYL